MGWWPRLARTFRPDRVSDDIDEELASHVEEAIAHGRDPDEARRAIGGPAKYREASRDISRRDARDLARKSRRCLLWRRSGRRKGVSPIRVGNDVRRLWTEAGTRPPAGRPRRPHSGRQSVRRPLLRLLDAPLRPRPIRDRPDVSRGHDVVSDCRRRPGRIHRHGNRRSGGLFRADDDEPPGHAAGRELVSRSRCCTAVSRSVQCSSRCGRRSSRFRTSAQKGSQACRPSTCAHS